MIVTGFTEIAYIEEVAEFRETVEKGAHLFFKYVRDVCIKFA